MKNKALSDLVSTFIAIAIVTVIFLPLFTVGVWAIWNSVVVEIFGIKPITFFQAMGLLVLCNLLFKSHGLQGNKK